MVRLGLLLSSIFSLEKNKRKPLGQQLKKIREGKGFSAKAGASSKWKGEGRTVHSLWLGECCHTWSGLLGWNHVTVGGESSEWGRHPAVCPHSAVGKGLLNNLFLILISDPLGTALIFRTAMASLFFPLSSSFIHLKAEMWQHWFECNLLLILSSRTCYSSLGISYGITALQEFGQNHSDTRLRNLLLPPRTLGVLGTEDCLVAALQWVLLQSA